MRVTAIGSPADREGGNAAQRNINTPARQTQEHPDEQIYAATEGFSSSWVQGFLSLHEEAASSVTDHTVLTAAEHLICRCPSDSLGSPLD
mmetsp:Transcript_6883/g.16678  ORF Transcript_6883/g.16678 Transcript_6883/m.16678 type:complete len:90 (-) Transcript_6883:68-337(-)